MSAQTLDGSKNEKDFRLHAYTFMTFLYGAAVHLIIAKAYEGHGLGKAPDLFLLTLIAFLFSDWASRSRLPRLLPETPAGYVYVCKISLEIICIFFLVSSFLLLVATYTDPELVTDAQWPWQTFGWFLVATAFWDYLMIRIMNKLDMIPLGFAVWIHGDAIDMRVTSTEYLGRFDIWKQERRHQIEAARNRDKEKISQDPDRAITNHLWILCREVKDSMHLHVFEGTIAAVAQFVANHVFQSNLLAGIALLLQAIWIKEPLLTLAGKVFGSEKAVYDLIYFRPALYAVLVAIALLLCTAIVKSRLWAYGSWLLVVGLLFFFRGWPAIAPWLKLGGFVAATFVLATFCYSFRSTTSLKAMKVQKFANRSGGWILAFSLIFLYFALPSPILVVLLASQQVLVNIFLQLGISADQPPAHQLSTACKSFE